MNATQLFIALIAILVGLFVIALFKPKFTPKSATIEEFKIKLANLLPHHDLLTKNGTPARLIVSLDGTQKAIIVLDKTRAEYIMGGLPIFTTDKLSQLHAIAQRIQAIGNTVH